MRTFSKKMAAVAAGTTLAVAGAGVAYAFWTSTGTGSGSASTGTVSANITVTASNSTDQLIPGGAAVALTLTADNPNTYSADISGDSLTLTQVRCGDTDVTADNWFALDAISLAGSAVLKPNTDGQSVSPTTPVSIKMLDDPANDQQVCKAAAVSFTFNVQ